MASHHRQSHSHYNHHYQTDSPSIHCFCCSDYSCLNCPPPLSTDQFHQAIASHLLQSKPNPNFFQTPHSNFCSHQQKRRVYHQLDQGQDTVSILASLLYRVEKLESSLLLRPKHGCDSLRDAAARVIQTHFRAFLVRRSRTLGQLKELAFVKSILNSLKSSIFRGSHVDFGAIYHKSMNLLLQLDSIEGDDPMVCDAKRLITRDLIRFLDSIDGNTTKRHSVSVKTVKSTRPEQPKPNKAKNLANTNHVRLDNEQSKVLENLRERVERISRLTELSNNDGETARVEPVDDFDENGIQGRRHGVKPKLKKCVSLTKTKNSLQTNREHPIGSEGRVSEWSDDQGEIVKKLNVEAVEQVMGTSQGSEDDDDVEDASVKNGGSTESSDEETWNGIVHRNENRSAGRGQGGRPLCSAPLPVKMEPRDRNTKL